MIIDRINKSLNSLTDKLEKYTLFFLFAIGSVMLIVTWMHVFFRYVVNSSLTWSEEFLKIALVYFCLISASILTKRRGHIGIVIFREKFPYRIQKIMIEIIYVLMFIISIILVACGIDLVSRSFFQKTPAMGIPYMYLYSSVPLSFFLMAVYEFANLIDDLNKYLKQKYVSD